MSKRKYSCEELGVCQFQDPCCHVSCTTPAQSKHPFAPGIVEGGKPAPLSTMELVGIALIWSALIGLTLGLMTAAIHWMKLPGWLA